jgi:hypothetical protein
MKATAKEFKEGAIQSQYRVNIDSRKNPICFNFLKGRNATRWLWLRA